MKNTIIVSAYQNLRRQNWSDEYHLPTWLDRSEDDYHHYFNNLCQLENQICVFSDNLKTIDICNNKSNICVLPLHTSPITTPSKEQINAVQVSKRYREIIHDQHINDPECKIPGYVSITNRKINFIKTAFEKYGKDSDYVWIDYGYFRSENNIPSELKFSSFSDDKIKLFNLQSARKFDLVKAITRGTVFISGCMIYIPGNLVEYAYQEWEAAKNYLYEAQIVDDDQTLLLVMYLRNSKLYHLTKMPNWNSVFEKRSAFNSIKELLK